MIVCLINIIDKYGYSDVICGVENGSSRHTENKKKYILGLGERPTDGSDVTTIMVKTKS